MMAPLLIVASAVVLALAAVATVFMLGMRAKTPWVLNRVRHFARGIGNPHQMKSAGMPGAYASVIRHRGRTSGKAYETPVVAEATEDGFVVAIVYGSHTDWLKNVLASGCATIVHEGRAYEVDRPEIIPIRAAAAYFPAKSKLTHRRFKITECLRVRRVDLEGSNPALLSGAASRG